MRWSWVLKLRCVIEWILELTKFDQFDQIDLVAAAAYIDFNDTKLPLIVEFNPIPEKNGVVFPKIF